jgi:hypothetical protein
MAEVVATAAYVRQVELALRDLPWRQRRDLVAELRQHLAELPEETNYYERLGHPERYAMDLRTAAGLQRRHGPIAFIRSFRPRNVVLVAAGALVLGLVIVGLGWVQSYEPLGLGNLSAYPKGSVDEPGGDSTSVVFHKGRPFSLAIEIRNNGAYGVRILGVPAVSPSVEARTLMYPPTQYGGSSALSPRPFQPFTLQPGQFDILVLRGAYRCHGWKGTGSREMLDFPVRYSFLWHTATASIPLPTKLVFVYKRNSGCG